MNIQLIDSPVGIDKEIQNLQNYLNSELATLWNNTDYYCFGRAAIINDKPVCYVSGIDYFDLITNDKLINHSFFLVRDTITHTGGKQYKANVDIYFLLNLQNLYDETYRCDELARRDITNLIYNKKNFTIKNIVIGKSALDEFKIKDSFRHDMQPRHVFKVETELNYNLIKNC